MASGRSYVCHSKRCAALIASTISRSEFMRHKTHAELWRATPYPAYPKNNFIRRVQKIIAKTFLNCVPSSDSLLTLLLVRTDYFVRCCFRLDKRQGDLRLKEHGLHGAWNGTGATTIAAAV